MVRNRFGRVAVNCILVHAVFMPWLAAGWLMACGWWVVACSSWLRAGVTLNEPCYVCFRGLVSEADDDDLAEAVVCLANGDGGWLLIGVRNDGSIQGARRRHGDSTDPRRVAALIADKTSPALWDDVYIEVLDGNDVIATHVPRPMSLAATTPCKYVRQAIHRDADGPHVPYPAQARQLEEIADRPEW